MLVSSVQFHWLFYAGRTLPNTFALTIVNVAYSYWMQASSPGSSQSITRRETERQLLRMIDCLVVATVVFRSEILLLLGPIVLLELSMVRIHLVQVILEGLKAGLASLAIALAVDSWFWQQPWMWAEGYVFWFNAVKGNSIAWGVSPWHTYFSTLLPKLSGIALPLALVAVATEQRFRSLKRKSKAYRLLAVILFAALGLTFFVSIARSLISSYNYPGGQALQRLHELELNNFSAAMVHIDGAAAETGCSRFGEVASASSLTASSSPWTYSKDESHENHKDYLQYTHLLTSQPEFHKHDFVILEQIDGFAGVEYVPLGQVKETCPAFCAIGKCKKGELSWEGLKALWNDCSPIQIKTEGKIWIMKRFSAE
ncbi:dolichyl-P-Man:Man(7)GlcNAc(2)-PP-dolichol alpha-1,6-mannosyltransferase [Modicella reniformis]|uniref:Mannosyltransferase n=1 Tax=Modicella reniformis TaxID=1440133 RepID=A0A9P6MC04_9FUNG|nr:dolichyl-P-Man:Man(7)GlcNAc(2)-PP-dolichol alpha-1,6-mannosyltransferase [Modicella reniformis]